MFATITDLIICLAVGIPVLLVAWIIWGLTCSDEGYYPPTPEQRRARMEAKLQAIAEQEEFQVRVHRIRAEAERQRKELLKSQTATKYEFWKNAANLLNH